MTLSFAGIVALIICIAMAIVSITREKNIFNPMTLMSLLWGIIIFLASLRLFDTIAASDLTYILIGVGILSFSIGCAMSDKVRFKWGKSIVLESSKGNYVINYRLTDFMAGMAVLLLAYPAYKSLTSLYSMTTTLTYIRSNVSFYNNAILNLICNYIIKPFDFAIIPICAINFFMEGKKDKFLLICTILIAAENVFINGGRFIILFLICNFFLAYKFSQKHIAVNAKTKCFILLGFAVAVIAIYNVTLMRGTTDVWGSLYAYISGCVPHLSNRLEIIQSHGQYTFGLAAHHGILEFVFSMLENVGFSIPDFYTDAVQLMNVEDLSVITTTGGTINAFVGPFFYFYLDFRIVGVVLGMMVYGWICNNSYRHIRRDINIRSLAVYMLLAQGLLTSFVRFQFYDMYYALAFVFFSVLIKKERKNI